MTQARTLSNGRGVLLDSFLSSGAHVHPDRIAVVDRAGPHTYGEVESGVQSLAAALVHIGIQKGEVVSWQLPNTVDAAIIHTAILRVGAISGPIPLIYRTHELASILGQSGTRVVFIPEEFGGTDFPQVISSVRGELPRLERIVVIGARRPLAAGAQAFEELIAEIEPVGVAFPHRDPDDPAAVIFTSGTGADPKGALHTHNTLGACLSSTAETFGLTGTDSVFNPSPVSHVGGLIFGLILPFALGSRVVLQDRWNPSDGFDAMQEWHPTFMVAVPTFLQGLIDEGARRGVKGCSLRTFLCGGAAVSTQLIARAEEVLECVASRNYGSTECPNLTGSGPLADFTTRAETDGYPVTGCEVRIVDEDGQPVADGSIGEISCRAPQLMSGYLGQHGSPFDPGGWLRTGDMGSLDDSGRLHVHGRKKDIIIRGGQNISSVEVEDVLRQHNAIADVALVGIPDVKLGERVCAFIIPSGETVPTIEELGRFLQMRGLARQKTPEVVVQLASFPVTDSGKVRKSELRERAKQLAAEQGFRG
jgi:cyclohexanecarboxylate-CoA ligase